MSDVFENKGAMTATIVVAAADSLNPGAANYVCDGVNDHVEIQAALDALPATGGEVVLLDGTFNVEVQINLDSYQTLRGMGRSTILTTSTGGLTILSAVGGVGTEKIGILITKLLIDGDSTATVGIAWDHVEESMITHVWVSDCTGNGMVIGSSSFNIFAANILLDNVGVGLVVAYSSHNAIVSNVALRNGNGILIGYSSERNTITGNVCYDNDGSGILITTGNYNEIAANVLSNNGTYGIEIYFGIHNRVINNVYNGNGTAPFNDGGTNTQLSTYVSPFSDGSDPQDSGYLIDANTEYARGWLRLPPEVQQVVRMNVYARSGVAEVDKMRGEFVIYGAKDNENYQTNNGSIANHPSASQNFAANDIIYWTITTAGVLALIGRDSVEVKVLHEAAGGDDCATNAYLRTVEIEYV